MNRQTLINAVGMGLKRAAARRTDPAQTIADTIELALDLERSMGRATAPVHRIDAPTVAEQAAGLPPNPNPNALAEIESIEEDELPDPGHAPVAPDPDHSPEPPLIVLSDSRGVDAELAKQSEKRKELKLKKGSLFLGNKLRVWLQDLVDWANQAFPRRIKVQPHGVDHEIELELQVRPFPVTGDLGRSEVNSTIKVVYMNARIASEIKIPGQAYGSMAATEVGISVSVASAQDGWPPVEDLLSQLKSQARELYRKRPEHITGRYENAPDLRSQLSAVRTVGMDPTKRTPKSAQIAMLDDDDTSLFRP